MENQEIDPITAFDTLYTSNQLQILKVVLPYMTLELQPLIALYIKLNELLITYHFYKNNKTNSTKTKPKDFDLGQMLRALSPFLSESEREMMNQFASMQENMEQFKQMSSMMSMMQDMNEDSPESILQNFLSEDQIAIFKMFQEDSQ